MAGLVVVVLAMSLGVAVVPGVVAEPRQDVRPSYFEIRHEQGSIRAADVSGSTTTLQIATRVRHEGGTAENVTVVVRAIDSQTGLLGAREETVLGTIEGEKETAVTTNLTVERQGGYRIETFVYEDGITRTSERRSVSGVGSLAPEYARSPVKFHDFRAGGTDKPAISTSIEDVRDGRATLNLTTFLTNHGDQAAGDVTLVISARQAESNVVADETRVSVGSLRPGRTATTAAELTVPDDYNYWLDAILLKDGVVVDTISEPANLDPQKTLQKGERQTDTGFQSGDFTGTERDSDRDRDRDTPTPTGGSGPGFGPAVALVGLVGAALLTARRNL